MVSRKIKRMVASVAAVAMLAGAVCSPANVFAAGILGDFDFNKGISTPWSIKENGPAHAEFDISDGWYNVEIINPGGKSRGGEDRWDLQLVHPNIVLDASHTYVISYTVKADTDGYIYSRIANKEGTTEIWHGNGNVTIEGGSEENKQGEISFESSWQPLKIEAGKTMTFTAEFSPKESMKSAEWAFQFGGDGEYGNGSGGECFNLGAKLSFSALSLTDKDAKEPGEEVVDIYKISDISVNQNGYVASGIKQATYAPSNGKDGLYREAQEGPEEIEFSLVKDGKDEVFTGKAAVKKDEDSGYYTYVLDFSEYKEVGEHYMLKVGSAASPEFCIADSESLYKNMYADALNYFYLNRSGIEINKQYINASGYSSQINSADRENVEGEYISADNLARSAGHEKDTGYIQSKWVDAYKGDGADVEKTNSQDVTGGWYNGDSYTKSVFEKGYSVWALMNIYDRALSNGTENNYKDGSLLLPENTNKAPDILDEVKWEMDFFRKMICKDGEYKDMLYTETGDSRWTGLAISPAQSAKLAVESKDNENPVYRIIKPVSTGATLNFAAAAAQFARLYKDYDEKYCSELLKEAENAYKAAVVNNDLSVPVNTHGTGFGQDNKDEFYWAACELYLTTGEEAYLTDMKKSECYLSVPSTIESMTNDSEKTDVNASFECDCTAALGTISLLVNSKGGNKNCSGKVDADMTAEITKNLVAAADKYCGYEEKQGFGVPFEQNVEESGELNGYPYMSNSYIMNNGIIMGLAYDFTRDTKYLDGAQRTMDYMLGRNPNRISYITGFGSYHTTFVYSQNWAAQTDADKFTLAPSGVLASGPNSQIEDAYIKNAGYKKGEVAPQCCYVDNIESWSTNDTDINLNASLAWMADFLIDPENTKKGEESNDATDNTGKNDTADLVYGDLNGDGVAELTDLTMLSIYLMDKSNASSIKDINTADVDANGIVDIADLARFKQYICHDPSVTKLGAVK